MRSFALSIALLAGTVTAEEAASGGGSIDPSLKGPGSLSDASPQRRKPMVSVFLGFPAGYWAYGGIPFSVGGRYLQPILHDGFIPTVNDSFSVEAGVDLFAIGRANFGFALAIPIEAMWALHFSSNFAGYLKLGVSLEARFGEWCAAGVCGGAFHFGPGFIGNLGILYKFTEAIALRVELGYPGLKVGLGFPL